METKEPPNTSVKNTSPGPEASTPAPSANSENRDYSVHPYTSEDWSRDLRKAFEGSGITVHPQTKASGTSPDTVTLSITFYKAPPQTLASARSSDSSPIPPPSQPRDQSQD